MQLLTALNSLTEENTPLMLFILTLLRHLIQCLMLDYLLSLIYMELQETDVLSKKLSVRQETKSCGQQTVIILV